MGRRKLKQRTVGLNYRHTMCYAKKIELSLCTGEETVKYFTQKDNLKRLSVEETAVSINKYGAVMERPNGSL